MEKTLIIAEKPSVAANIAAALGAKRNDQYFEGNGYYITNAFGHLYTLADTKDYVAEMENWNLKDYPFIPQIFKYKMLDDPGVKKQIKTIKDLVKKSDKIINACDSDREGELIFSELKRDLNINLPIKRLWVTSHTPKDIKKGMSNLLDDMKNLEKAAYCRQQIDWIYGINFTVCFSLMAENKLKLGRVILATLKLIFDREVAISTFKSEVFYTLKTEFKSTNESYVGIYLDENNNTRFKNKEQLLNIEKLITNKPGKVIKKEGSSTIEYAPKLFNLTDLQGYITSKYDNFSSDKVLKVMQSLYEMKHLTYPRTESRYLDNSLINDAEESLNSIINIPELGIKNRNEVKFHTDKSVFDSSKVNSHPAIMPTYIVPDINNLSEDEKIVYIEVAKRFLSHFLSAAIYDTVEIITQVNNYKFITRGKVLVKEGWKQLYTINNDDEDQEQIDNVQEYSITASNINLGDIISTDNSNLKEGKTNPPKHFTEKSLLVAMENCGKQVENDEEVLKGFTIGTPATRSETIKKLLKCNYIIKKGRKILITDLGAQVIHYFPIKRLLKVDFTGQIEKTLKDIENGQYDSDVFMEKMITYILKSINELKQSNIPKISKPVVIVGVCPKCNKNVIETDKAFSCEGTRKKECNFALWKDDKFFKTFGKKLTATIAKDLIKNQKASVKGLKSPKKEDVKFNAVIKLKENKETGYWNYELDFESKAKGGRKTTKKAPIKFKSKASASN